MTAKIMLSVLTNMGTTPEAFKAKVDAFVQAKMDHRTKSGDPAPTAPAMIENLVKRVPPKGMDEFVADYVIVDDSPPPKSLAERKGELLALLAREEQAALEAILSPAKRRLLGMEVQRVSMLKTEDRTKTDKAVLEESVRVAKLSQEVQLHSARMMAEVDDLTEETIEDWAPKEFGAK
jgi:hypothetical protein